HRSFSLCLLFSLLYHYSSSFLLSSFLSPFVSVFFPLPDLTCAPICCGKSTPFFLSQSPGSIFCMFLSHIVKWRCGPDEKPRLPISAICSPTFTLSPFFTWFLVW